MGLLSGWDVHARGIDLKRKRLTASGKSLDRPWFWSSAPAAATPEPSAVPVETIEGKVR
jgi:hypothetical protein